MKPHPCFIKLAFFVTSLNCFPGTFDCAAADIVLKRIEDLALCTPEQLDLLFASGNISAIPTGRLYGLPLVRPGKSGAVMSSKMGRLAWSGKNVQNDASSAVNTFFGLSMISADVRIEPSRRDGRPAMVLDYSQKSLLYQNVRDEVREVMPGIYLGYMHDVRDAQPVAKRWFAFQQVP